MKRYQCHKVVQATKIRAIGTINAKIYGEEPHEEISVTHEWIEKHDPQVGGYLVIYQDGYLSYSPAKAFEEGYKEIN